MLTDLSVYSWGRRGRGRMAVEFTTTCAISAYYHLSCEFESRSARGVLESTLGLSLTCDISVEFRVLQNPTAIALTAMI